jgi:hypothetical protein
MILALLMTLHAVSASTETVAESSDFTATCTHADVMRIVEALDVQSDLVNVITFGESVEHKSLPLLILADPPCAAPPTRTEREAGDDRLVIFAFGNIHAGEVCGKEALLMLAREWTDHPPTHLLDDCIILFAPIYNADGNDRMSPDNRPGQIGPTAGMGERPNAQGFDLNRDYVKLEAPETRAMVKLLNEWDPDLIIDTHTTNGSRHRYAMTFAAPLNPSGHPEPIGFVHSTMLPDVAQRLRDATGYESFYYGNADRAHTQWFTYSAQARYGGNYHGLRGHLSVLSEAYSYIPFRDRIEVTRAFVRELINYADEHHEDIREMRERVKRDIINAGENPQPDDVVGIRHRIAAFARPVTLLGYEPRGNTPQTTHVIPPTEDDVPRDYTVVHLGRFEMERGVNRPGGYLVPIDLTTVLEILRAHGVTMEPAAGMYTVERYTITDVDRAPRAFQGHRNVLVEAEAARDTVDFVTPADGRPAPARMMFIPTAQPLGTLIVYLLEPESEDGLTAWNFFDEYLEAGRDFPVLRVVDRR